MKALLKALAVMIAVLCSGMAVGQAAPITGVVQNQYGQPVPYAQVRVCSVTSTGNPCTPTTPIYADYNLTIPLGNPTSTDSSGNYAFYVPALAAPNVYVVQTSPNNGTAFSYLYSGPYCSLSGCTFSGPITATIFNATQSPYYEINGVQISSAALSDAANIAFLNANNIFTGTTNTFNAIVATTIQGTTINATTGFQVGGVALACTNLSDCSNLAKLNASNTFTGTTQTGPIWNATTGFRYNGAAPNNHVLLGNGTNYVDSASIPWSVIASGGTGPFAGAGIPYATSTTASTVATSPQLVTALNTSPSTTLATALLPVATNSTFGTVEPDNSTITISAGVISAAAPTVTCTDVHASRAWGTVYHNTNSYPISVNGSGSSTGSMTNNITCDIGATSSPTLVMFTQTNGATTSGGVSSFNCGTPGVPAGWYYEVSKTNDVTSTPTNWVECAIQ